MGQQSRGMSKHTQVLCPSNTICKPPITTARPHNGTFVESPQYPNVGLQYSRSQQPVTETSIPTQWASAPQYPTGTMASDTFRRPVTAQGHKSPTGPTRESEGTMLANRAQPAQFQYRQSQPTVTGSCSLAIDPPTPPDGSPLRRSANQPKRSPRRVNQIYPRPINVR